MNVTHVIDLADHPGLTPFSGAEHHLFLLMAEQQARGWNVEFAPLVFRSGPRLERKFKELREDGLIVSPVLVDRPPRARTYLQLFPRLVGFFSSRRHRLIHTHLDIACTLAKAAADLAGCRRLLSTIHNNEPHYAHPAWRLPLRLLEGRSVRTIAISEAVRTWLIDAVGLAPTRVVTVPYGLPPPSPGLSRTEARRRLGLEGDQFTVGFVGRLVAQKNPACVLHAVEGLPEVRLVVIGTGELEPELRRLAQRMPPERVRFAGSHERAAELMPAFDLLCLPSLWEGFGLVLLEAMVRGVPVVGSAAGAIPEVLGDGKYGLLVRPDDAQALRACIDRARADPGALTACAERAKAWVADRFTVDRMAEQTLAVYRQVINGERLESSPDTADAIPTTLLRRGPRNR